MRPPAALLALLLGGAAARGDQLFVVVSAPRSGTEWLRLMLGGHPRICCDGEILLRLGRQRRPGGRGVRAALGAFAAGAAPGFDDVLRPCRKAGAGARGFKWFDGQGGATVAAPTDALGNLSAWRRATGAKLIVLERQGLAKLVSDRLKHDHAVPTHCRDSECAARVARHRVTLDPPLLEAQLDASVHRFGALLTWARAQAAFGDVLYVAYQDLAADPDRELRRAYRFLGVDDGWRTNASVLTKSVQTPLSEIVSNYGAVREALARTKWAGEVRPAPRPVAKPVPQPAPRPRGRGGRRNKGRPVLSRARE